MDQPAHDVLQSRNEREIFSMRDPERIPKVLEKLQAIWRLHPDWRLGQLIANVADWAEKSVWDMEEDALVAAIEGYLKRAGHPTPESL